MRPSFRPPTATASQARPTPWLALIAVAAGLWVASGRGFDWPTPVSPSPPAGPDLTTAFAANDNRSEARQHAAAFAAICGSLADYLEYDGTRSEPLIKTGVQIDEFRRALRQTRTRGWSFLAQYPALGPPIESYLTEQLGTSGGPIDKAQREKWIAAMRQLQTCAQYAAR